MDETAAPEEAKLSLISMAQCWHRLAREAEDAERTDFACALESNRPLIPQTSC
jgi:hypothetical protein